MEETFELALKEDLDGRVAEHKYKDGNLPFNLIKGIKPPEGASV